MSIEEQIDNAIRDCTLGPDAMRWTPDPEVVAENPRMPATRTEYGSSGGLVRVDPERAIRITIDGGFAPDELELVKALRRDGFWRRPRWWHRFTRRPR